MIILIDIPDNTYADIQEHKRYTDFTILDLIKAIRHSTPIPDNATVGEVFCTLTSKEPICDTASYFTIDKDLWNSPYQKGGKE